MTNQSGTAVQYMSFDAWGRRRNHTDWTYTNVPTSFLVSRGYTMHEHLDQFGLINMNGRVYDPVLGRFLEPDNYVQAPGLTQSYNRYSYCFNNPLKFTDPSGYFSWRNFWSFTVSAVVGVGVTILTGGNVLAGAWAGAFAGEMVRSGGDVSKSLNAGGMSIFGAVALAPLAGPISNALAKIKVGNIFSIGHDGKIAKLANRTVGNLLRSLMPKMDPIIIESISNGSLLNAAGGSNFSWVVSCLFPQNQTRTLNYQLINNDYEPGDRKCIEYANVRTSGKTTDPPGMEFIEKGSFDQLEEKFNQGYNKGQLEITYLETDGSTTTHRIPMDRTIIDRRGNFNVTGPDPLLREYAAGNGPFMKCEINTYNLTTQKDNYFQRHIDLVGFYIFK